MKNFTIENSHWIRDVVTRTLRVIFLFKSSIKSPYFLCNYHIQPALSVLVIAPYKYISTFLLNSVESLYFVRVFLRFFFVSFNIFILGVNVTAVNGLNKEALPCLVRPSVLSSRHSLPPE